MTSPVGGNRYTKTRVIIDDTIKVTVLYQYRTEIEKSQDRRTSNRIITAYPEEDQ